jgi:SAM-dependent methyltransferase
MSEIYDNPEYYEIAFDFRNIVEEADLFEACFRRFSLIPVHSVLELGCGTCPHMIELARRGYSYTGMDINPHMLSYSGLKAEQAGIQTELVQGNMITFSFQSEFDFVYILLGSLCARNTQEIHSHFDSVVKALKPGGLYLLDWCIQFEPPWACEDGSTWEMSSGDTRITTTVSWKAVSLAEQIFEETIRFEVCDAGRTFTLTDTTAKRAIYPQEFRCLVSARSDLEFVGWWNMWDLEQPLEKATKIGRPIILLRKT